MSDNPRLQKALADMGLGSRREIEGWIEAGRVLVNGRAAVLGQRLGPGDQVSVDGRPLRQASAQAAPVRVIVYNKPEGEICSRRDPEGRPTVFTALPRPATGRWVIVGRLDINTSGLLLATDSGELANRLMHPGSAIEREYLVRVLGEVDAGTLQRLRQGVLLDDGMAAFEAIRERSASGSNQWFSVVLREGRNREVRRLWESQGCRISRLKRVRFGPVSLGPRDRRGSWRDLSEAELKALGAAVGMDLGVKAAAGLEASKGSQKTPVAAPRRGARETPARRESGAQRKGPRNERFEHFDPARGKTRRPR
jgi:23S rRNA pseudouridine2605 synthase